MKSYRTLKIFTATWFSVLVLFISTGGVLLMPSVVSAQNNLFPCSGGIDNNESSGATGGSFTPGGSSTNRACTFSDLVELAQAVANKIVQFGLLLSPFIFAYAGWLLLTSGDSPQKRKTAQKIFMNVFIGLAIMLAAWLIVKLVLTALVSTNITSDPNFPININS